MKVDKKDRQIINLLQSNARMPVTEIARQVHLARATVQERIAKLEKRQVIKGYHIDIDENKLHGELVYAQVKIKVATEYFDPLVSSLKSMSEVINCYAISGDADLLIEVKVISISTLDNLLSHIGQLSGVQQTHSDILLKHF